MGVSIFFWNPFLEYYESAKTKMNFPKIQKKSFEKVFSGLGVQKNWQRNSFSWTGWILLKK